LADSGLYYAGSRFYNADIGRILPADTIVPGGAGNPQALNPLFVRAGQRDAIQRPDGILAGRETTTAATGV
jgi:hypothetical protein